ncbi:hypothetical protein GCM10020256_69800 [Streptomyces thermocoprophilus]
MSGGRKPDTWRLPRGVVALRARIFEKVNGDRAVTLPNATYGPEVFERVYAHPAAVGRSAGAGLSDLFWYWLSPGPEVHQEHLEPGPRYDEVAATTRRMLAGGSAELTAAAAARSPGSWTGCRATGSAWCGCGTW